MTTTLEKLSADLPIAMKARDSFKTNTLRQAIAAVRTAEKAGSVARELGEDEVQKVLASEVKKRRESAEIYFRAEAFERASLETAEADFIEEYLPKVVAPERLETLVADAIFDTAALTVKDMGAVMKHVRSAASDLGRVDGKVLSDIVRRQLGA